MDRKINISATIVLYKEDKKTLQETINSFLATPLTKKLFLIDNSPTDKLSYFGNYPEVEYRFLGENIGFGAGHNQVLTDINNLSDYHLVLNPDVTFQKEVIPNLINELKKHDNVTMIAPKVLFPNKAHQYTARKYPGVLDLIIRRLKIFKNRIYEQEYRNKDLTKPMLVEYLTGCFQLYKTSDYIQLKGFDERYFLYMEDVDICKKIDTIGKKKIYFPQEKIYHILKQGSSKNLKLFLFHTVSAFKYFFKWQGK